MGVDADSGVEVSLTSPDLAASWRGVEVTADSGNIAGVEVSTMSPDLAAPWRGVGVTTGMAGVEVSLDFVTLSKRVEVTADSG